MSNKIQRNMKFYEHAFMKAFNYRSFKRYLTLKLENITY